MKITSSESSLTLVAREQHPQPAELQQHIISVAMKFNTVNPSAVGGLANYELGTLVDLSACSAGKTVPSALACAVLKGPVATVRESAGATEAVVAVAEGRLAQEAVVQHAAGLGLLLCGGYCMAVYGLIWFSKCWWKSKPVGVINVTPGDSRESCASVDSYPQERGSVATGGYCDVCRGYCTMPLRNSCEDGMQNLPALPAKQVPA